MEGLDWGELETEESVLRLLSGLLKEQTLSMDTLVFLHASHAHAALHLETTETSSVSDRGKADNRSDSKEETNKTLSDLTVYQLFAPQ